MNDFSVLAIGLLFLGAIAVIFFSVSALKREKLTSDLLAKNRIMNLAEDKSAVEILSMLPKSQNTQGLVSNLLSLGGAFFLVVMIIQFGLQPFFAYALGLIFYISIRIIQAVRKDKTKQKLYEKLPAVSDMILYHNRIGTPVHLIIDFLEKNAHPPIKQFFVLVNQKIHAGILPHKALLQTAQQYKMLELDLLALILSLQNRRGFTTQSAFLFLSKHWRNQLILKKKIRSILAENRMTLLVLAAMPFIVSGFNYMRDPLEFQQLFTTAIGRMVFGFGILLYCVGIVSFYLLSRVE